MLADSRADYTNGGVTGLVSERSGSTSHFYHGDQLGSTRGLSNSSQSITDAREYDSFGLTIATSGSTATPFRFAGGEGYQADADSGLMLLGARYYDPSLGRFISRDPIGYEGGLNLYGYCENDPVNHSDPSGHVGVPFPLPLPGPWWLTPPGLVVLAVLAVAALAFIGYEIYQARRGGRQGAGGPSPIRPPGELGVPRPKPGPVGLPAPRPSSDPADTIPPKKGEDFIKPGPLDPEKWHIPPHLEPHTGG